MAPMDAGYNWGNETPSTIMYDTTKTFQSKPLSLSLFAFTSFFFPLLILSLYSLKLFVDTWHGSINQESMSVITLTDTTSFEGKGFTTFGYEYTPGPAGHITWAMNETATWKLDHTAIGPNVAAGIGQRLVSEEPMVSLKVFFFFFFLFRLRRHVRGCFPLLSGGRSWIFF